MVIEDDDLCVSNSIKGYGKFFNVIWELGCGGSLVIVIVKV